MVSVLKRYWKPVMLPLEFCQPEDKISEEFRPGEQIQVLFSTHTLVYDTKSRDTNSSPIEVLLSALWLWGRAVRDQSSPVPQLGCYCKSWTAECWASLRCHLGTEVACCLNSVDVLCVDVHPTGWSVKNKYLVLCAWTAHAIWASSVSLLWLYMFKEA